MASNLPCGDEDTEELVQTKPLAEQITPLIQRQVEVEEEDEEEIFQAKAISSPTPEVTPNLAARISTIRGGGQPLPASVRDLFEPRLGYDFSQVRMHTDRRASEAALAMKARAFTVGRDVVFGAGQYAPNTNAGRRLLAHELTHVMQQMNGRHRIQRTGLVLALPLIGGISVGTIASGVLVVLSAILATVLLIEAYEYAVERGIGVSAAQQALATSIDGITIALSELIRLIRTVLEEARRVTNPSDPCRRAIRELESRLDEFIGTLATIQAIKSNSAISDAIWIAQIREQCELLVERANVLFRYINNVITNCGLIPTPSSVYDTGLYLSRQAIARIIIRIRHIFASW